MRPAVEGALEEWVQPLQPLLDAVDLGLKLLRQGASPVAYDAQNGSFELSLSVSRFA